MAGAFLTFEGIDGSGKSTQLRLLANYLRSRKFDVVTTREPGGTPLGTRLRQALLDVEEQVDPLAELLLYAADRAQHVNTLLRPALAANRIVLSDRYSDATIAYQGAGRGFAPDLIHQIVQLATGGLKPDLTLIFDLPVAECMTRVSRRAQAQSVRTGDRFDAESADFHTRVRDAYLRLAKAAPARIRLIDASGSIEETNARVMHIVEPFLEQKMSDAGY